MGTLHAVQMSTTGQACAFLIQLSSKTEAVVLWVWLRACCRTLPGAQPQHTQPYSSHIINKTPQRMRLLFPLSDSILSYIRLGSEEWRDSNLPLSSQVGIRKLSCIFPSSLFTLFSSATFVTLAGLWEEGSGILSVPQSTVLVRGHRLPATDCRDDNLGLNSSPTYGCQCLLQKSVEIHGEGGILGNPCSAHDVLPTALPLARSKGMDTGHFYSSACLVALGSGTKLLSTMTPGMEQKSFSKTQLIDWLIGSGTLASHGHSCFCDRPHQPLRQTPCVPARDDRRNAWCSPAHRLWGGWSHFWCRGGWHPGCAGRTELSGQTGRRSLSAPRSSWNSKIEKCTEH